ncbi:YhgE/Pip domain-containing protein, partial [Leucobacter sp. BZR 635]
MRQSWQIFTRDVKRLARQRKAWIIVVGILVTPALYAWFNINAFWDPYANTQNVKIAVANLDRGGESELTGKVNIGDQVVEQLAENDQLGWQFMSESEAQRAVKRGDAYAAIVIPKDFSADLLTMTTGEFTQPALEYYVNEKASAIAPKITDVGAATLSSQITSAFKEQVAAAASESVKDGGQSVETKLNDARGDTLNAFDDAAKTIDSARKNIAKLQDGLGSSRESLASSQATLGEVKTILGDMQVAVSEAQALAAETQQQIVTFGDAATSAYLQGTTLLADAAASANVSVSELSQQLTQASGRLDASITELTAVVAANEQTIEQLTELLAQAEPNSEVAERLQSALDMLKDQNAAHQQLLGDLAGVNTDTAAAVQAVAGAADALGGAMDSTKGAAAGMRAALSETVPEVNAAMTKLSASAGAFGAALGAQQTVIDQAATLLGDIGTQLGATGDALERFDGDLKNMGAGVQTARADVLALGTASDFGALATLTGLDPQQISEFVASPVTIDEQAVFPVAAYGSAMAALFTNLSLWIGAFVLMVIFKIEVDTEGLEDVTVSQAYMGRFFLLGSLAMLQAVIVSIGNLIIGVQTASAVAFVATAVFTALVYVSIIYALSVAFGHVGRGLCVLLVIMQIPGASGLYPIELMPGFFRAIYPLLPFSYGIDAMRETIAGFYGGHYWRFVGVLALMMLLAFVLGLVLRRRLANFNLLFNREIASTDLLIGEKVQVVGSGHRLADIFRAVQHQGEYREDLDRRAKPFTEHYPALKRVTLIVGITGTVTIAVAAWALPNAKAPLLGIWVLWCLLVMGFLVVIEYIKQSYAHAHELAATVSAPSPVTATV